MHCVTPTNNFKEIVEDIYNLSFMTVHSTNKMRLPVTTGYADKCSTFSNKGYLPAGSESGIFYV